MRLIIFLSLLFLSTNAQLSFDITFRPYVPVEHINGISGIWNNKLYVFGGIKRDGGNNPVAQTDIFSLDLSSLVVNNSKGLNYDPSIQWQTTSNVVGTIIPSGSVQSSVQIGSRLYTTYWVTRLDDPGIATVGANFGSNKMAIFDLASLTYVNKDNIMPRTDSSACTMTDYSQYIYVVGGDNGNAFDANGGNQVTIYFDINANSGTGQWSTHTATLVNARWNAGCAFDRDGNNGYIFGGSGATRDSVLGSIEKLSGGISGSWAVLNGQNLKTARSHAPCITDRHSMSTAGVKNYRIYCIGGRLGDRTQTLQTVETFNTDTDTVLLQTGDLVWKVYKQSLVQYPLQTTSNVLFWIGGEYVESSSILMDKIYYLTLGDVTTGSPTPGNTNNPTSMPTIVPSVNPTIMPTQNTIVPSSNTNVPSMNTVEPTLNTVTPSVVPSTSPTVKPSNNPVQAGKSNNPTQSPTDVPTQVTDRPTTKPIATNVGTTTTVQATTTRVGTTTTSDGGGTGSTTTTAEPKEEKPPGISNLVLILIIVFGVLLCCLLLFLILWFCVCKKEEDDDDDEKKNETNELQKIKTVSTGDVNDKGRTSTNIKNKKGKKTKTIDDSDDDVIDKELNTTAGKYTSPKTVSPDTDSDGDNTSDSELNRKYGKNKNNKKKDSSDENVSDDELNAKYGKKNNNNNNKKSTDDNGKKNKYMDDDSESSSSY